MVWQAVASIGGGLLGKLFGSASGSNAQAGLNRKDTKWMYDQQDKHWRGNTEWFNTNGWTQMREGLEKAGYNPLMALGASPQSGATVQGTAMDNKTNAWSLDMPHSIAQEIQNLKNTNADTQLKKAQTEENISRSSLEIAQRIATDENLPFDIRLKSMQVIGSQLNNELIGSQIHLNNAQHGLINQQTKESQQRSRLTSAQVEQVHQEIELLKNQKIITDKQAQWLHDHPKQASVSFGIGQWTGAVGNIFGGSAGVSYSVKK